MLLPFQNPSILQPFIDQHPPLSTQQYPPLMSKKRTALPHSLDFRYCPVFFPTNHQSQAVCSHTLGMGRHPRQPQGRDFPPSALDRPPGSPEKAAREGGVCAQQAAGSAGRQGPRPRDVGASWVPAPGATRRAMPPRMMAPLGEARHRVFSSHWLWSLKRLSVLSPSTRPLPLCLLCSSGTPCLPPRAQLYCGHLPGDPGP